MNQTASWGRSPQRPLSIGPLRAFEAVARLLSFSAAAEELHLTQSAISRQIRTLEDEVGAALLLRGTRHVELTSAGAVLLRAALVSLKSIDTAVRQVRQAKGRRIVNLTTFPSFASMWLIPRLCAFPMLHPNIDIRVSANNQVIDLDEGEFDLALRYTTSGVLPANSKRLFSEALTPVLSPWLADQISRGAVPALTDAASLCNHTLIEEDSPLNQTFSNGWRDWLQIKGVPYLEPRRWLFMNFTHQQVQSAVAGQGLALAPTALMAEALSRGELLEPFGTDGRVYTKGVYALHIASQSAHRPEVQEFVEWIVQQAELTRKDIGEVDSETLAGPTEQD